VLRFRKRPFWLYCALGRIEIATGKLDLSRKDWQRALPGLLVSVVSLGVVLYFVDLQELGQALLLADYRFIAAGVLVTILWLVVRGKVWQTLLPERVPYKTVFLTLSEGYLLNNILPFRLGEVGRAFLLSRKTPLRFWQVFSSILIERALDMSFATALLLSTLGFVVGGDWARQAAVGVGLVVSIGLLGLYLVVRKQEWVLNVFHKLSARWSILNRFGGKALPAFISGLGVLMDSKRFVKAIVWMVINWTLGVLLYFAYLLAFFPDAQLLWAGFSLGAASLGIAAPSSPGAVGVLELTLVAALSLFNLNPSFAFAFAVTAHFLNYLIIGVLGAYALSKDNETLLGLYRQARGTLHKTANPT
jgi:glycosyltransferase 2 family protein